MAKGYVSKFFNNEPTNKILTESLNKIRSSYKSKEIEILTEILNNFIDIVGAINLDGKVYQLEKLNKSTAHSDLQKIIKVCVDIQDHADVNFPAQDDHSARIERLIEYMKNGYEEAHYKIRSIYSKAEIEFTNSFSQDLEQGIKFFLYHLGNTLGISKTELSMIELKSLQNDIFQKFSSSVTIPVLKDWFIYIKDNCKTQYTPEEFVDCMFDFLGDERHKIAELAIDISAENMGKRAFDKPMRDPLENPSYLPWKQAISSQIADAIEHNKQDQLILELDDSGYCMHSNTPGNKFGVLHHKDDFIEGFKHNDSHKHSYYHFEYKPGEKIVPGSLTCVHKMHSDKDLAKFGKITIQAIEADKLEEQTLLEILWNISHGTFFLRGQAAITKFILEALAQEHHFKLSFAENWLAPKHNYDQQALSVLDEQVFITECLGNIILSGESDL